MSEPDCGSFLHRQPPACAARVPSVRLAELIDQLADEAARRVAVDAEPEHLTTLGVVLRTGEVGHTELRAPRVRVIEDTRIELRDVAEVDDDELAVGILPVGAEIVAAVLVNHAAADPE